MLGADDSSPMSSNIFRGCITALMTPCDEDGTPDFDSLVATAKRLVETGMRGVVYCGSMGDWPLLTDEQRQDGVSRLAKAGLPVVSALGRRVRGRRSVTRRMHVRLVRPG